MSRSSPWPLPSEVPVPLTVPCYLLLLESHAQLRMALWWVPIAVLLAIPARLLFSALRACGLYPRALAGRTGEVEGEAGLIEGTSVQRATCQEAVLAEGEGRACTVSTLRHCLIDLVGV